MRIFDIYSGFILSKRWTRISFFSKLYNIISDLLDMSKIHKKFIKYSHDRQVISE